MDRAKLKEMQCKGSVEKPNGEDQKRMVDIFRKALDVLAPEDGVILLTLHRVTDDGEVMDVEVGVGAVNLNPREVAESVKSLLDSIPAAARELSALMLKDITERIESAESQSRAARVKGGGTKLTH